MLGIQETGTSFHGQASSFHTAASGLGLGTAGSSHSLIGAAGLILGAKPSQPSNDVKIERTASQDDAGRFGRWQRYPEMGEKD